jgi:5'-3' exonuclease
MPAAIDNKIKTNVIGQWLGGDSRDKIATDNKIGAGTVSGIINEFKKGTDALEYESVRGLSISCKKHGTNLGGLASCIRLKNHIDNLGANQDEIEGFIANLANFPEPKKVFEAANQIAQTSLSESIPIKLLSNHIKQQQEEKRRLEEEIKQRRAILESTNVDIITLKEYKKLEEELHKHGFSMKYPHTLISVLQTVSQIGYEKKLSGNSPE